MAGQARHRPSRSCYVSGCRRPECRDAERRYRRAWRARQRGIELLPDLPSELGGLDDRTQHARLSLGAVEVAVNLQIDSMLGVRDTHPALCAVATVLGRDLDIHGLATSHASLSKALRETLGALERSRAVSRPRLEAVRNMAGKSPGSP